MKVVKIVGIVAGGLVGLVLLLGLMVSLFFDPNDYRGEVADKVRQHTGRELEIDGDLKLSIFPWLAVEVGPARLSEASGFGDKPFVEIQGARAGIRLMPLLRRQVEIGELRLDGMRLRLVKDKAGKTNWEDLSGEPSVKEADTSDDAGGLDLEQLAIGGIVISDAALVWEDLQAGSKLALTGFDLSTGPVKLGQPVDLDMSFALDADDKQHMQMTLATTVEVAKGFSSLSAENLDLKLLISDPELPGGSVEMTGAASAIDLALDSGDLSVKGFVGQALGATFQADLNGKAVLSDAPTITGKLTVPVLSPRDLLTRVGSPLVTTDPEAMSAFSLDAVLTYNGKSVALSEVKAILDQTRLEGRFSVLDLQSQAMSFDLAVDAIDLDRYLPPATEDEAADSQAGDEDTELDLGGLKSLNAKGQLRIGELRMSGLVFNDAQVTVNAADGILRLHPFTTRFYGGTYQGDVRLDGSGDLAKLSLNERLSGVQMAPVMKALSDHQMVSGSAGGGFTLTATGKTVKGMLGSLAGNLDLAVTEGALEGVDLVYELQRAQSLLAKQSPPARAGEKRTPFEAMKISAIVKDGVVSSDDLNISTSVMKITGVGGVNLVAQTLDYRLKARVQEAAPADATQNLGDLRGATIPLRIGGSLSEPKVTVDVEDVIKDKAKEQIEEKVDEWKKKLFGN